MAWGVRHTFAILAFLGHAIDYFMRVNLPITIVAMVKQPSSNDSPNFNGSAVCRVDLGLPKSNLSEHADVQEMEHMPQIGEFDWSPAEQGMILGSIYYGYISTQLCGGFLTERFGGKWVIIGSLSIASAVNFSFPYVVRQSPILFSVFRALQGMVAALSYVGIYAMTSIWIPKEEKGTLLTFIMAGGIIGMIVAYPACAFIADDFGWEYVFYISGVLSLLIVISWLLFVFSYPSQHPRITQEEKKYIEENTGVISSDQKLPRPPYLTIIKSRPVITLIIVQSGLLWGAYIVMTGIPTYLANIQSVEMKSNGLLSAIPFISCYVCSFIWAFGFHLCTRRKLMSHSVARKFFTSISLYGQAAGLIWLAYIGCNRVLAIFILGIIMGANSAICCSMLQNPVDLSPNYAGTIFGIVNTFSHVTGFLTPFTTGSLTNSEQTFEAWRSVFLLGAGILIATNTQYLIFGNFEEQKWNTYWLDLDSNTNKKVAKKC